jgi:succinate dehydrogenase cytochrome b subunit
MRGQLGEIGYFWLHRFHSMAGLFLTAAYIFLFLIPYSSAMQGPVAFNNAMLALRGIPLLSTFTVVIVGAMAIFYGALSFMTIHGSGANVVSYGRYRNWMYLLQRVAFLMILPAFIYHVSNISLKTAFGDRVVDYAMMDMSLGKLWVSLIYITGVLGAAFYIGNGFALMAIKWGLAATKWSRDAFAAVGWTITFVLAAWGLIIVFAF